MLQNVVLFFVAELQQIKVMDLDTKKVATLMDTGLLQPGSLVLDPRSVFANLTPTSSIQAQSIDEQNREFQQGHANVRNLG